MTGTPTTDRRHRVLVIGSGFGGLFATKGLRRADVEVTVIARTTSHLFQPLLYQVATGILSEGEVAPATREVLKRQRNARVLLGEVTSVDLAEHTVSSVVLGQRTVTPYDTLIVAAGAGQSYFGHPEFARYAPGMKSIDDALELRGRIFGVFELAELTDDPAERERLMTFVVVGAGPTGVEMAGQIRELSHRTLRHDFRRIDPAAARVVLLDAGPQVLPAFGHGLGERTLERLTRLGVDVQLNAMVVDVDATGIVVKEGDDTRRIDSVCKIWAAGVAASPLGKQLADASGAQVDHSGRILIQPDLTLPGHPEVFVLGDMISLNDYPGVAQVAIQGGKYAAEQVKRRLAGKQPKGPFRYFDKGNLATIARFDAVADLGRFTFTGFTAWVLWLVVHIFYLVGFKNRVTTVLHWVVSFIGRGRSERTVSEQQVLARIAIDQLGGERFTATANPAHPIHRRAET